MRNSNERTFCVYCLSKPKCKKAPFPTCLCCECLIKRSNQKLHLSEQEQYTFVTDKSGQYGGVPIYQKLLNGEQLQELQRKIGG